MNILKDLKIFIVDDEVFYLNTLKQHIINLGFNKIHTFENGIDCINELEEKPDIIFLDYNMDDLSGYDVLKKIKNINPNIYVVMVSGQEDIKVAIKTIKQGAFDYIQKSRSEEEEIKNVLHRIIRFKDFMNEPESDILDNIIYFN